MISHFEHRDSSTCREGGGGGGGREITEDWLTLIDTVMWFLAEPLFSSLLLLLPLPLTITSLVPFRAAAVLRNSVKHFMGCQTAIQKVYLVGLSCESVDHNND